MRNRKKKKTFNRKTKMTFKLGKMTIGFMAIFVILPLCIFLLSQTNQMTMRGDDISKLEKRKQELTDEKQRLEVEAARLQSIQEIQKDVSKTNMVPTKKVNYINSSTGVAVNR
ncbi:hypothetical protein C4544_06565 [candidate division WS5 bacterium]|uniref:Cell division protein FtsL n=1 Tax=candidate division WS5 bacterium TaxID=2093353 RepID=A0A419DA86_9BACT|nr:MAG: hypothetical protein C4544_06565 [candidate division WS5 bacterium]